MIGLNLKAAKGMFFDAPKIMAAVDRATRNVLSRFGAFVQTRAKSSIRRRKRRSRPGEPPTNRTGLLKRFIFFGYDAAQRSVPIGPVRLGGKTGEALPGLEYGGVTVVPESKAPNFVVGEYGPIRLAPLGSGKGRKHYTLSGALNVVRVKLLTSAMADRAARIWREAGLCRRREVMIEARPYMGPAFAKEQEKLPALWRDSVK